MLCVGMVRPCSCYGAEPNLTCDGDLARPLRRALEHNGLCLLQRVYMSVGIHRECLSVDQNNQKHTDNIEQQTNRQQTYSHTNNGQDATRRSRLVITRLEHEVGERARTWGGEQNKSSKKYNLIKNFFCMKSLLTLSYYILRVLGFNYVLKLHKYTTLFVY